jgi:aspartyl-tRNA(Asn)/glutamyl-tRNA(Gln) amidotransferase subunit C
VSLRPVARPGPDRYEGSDAASQYPDLAALRTESETMHVDETTVRRIARLARIKITDDEAKSLEGELSGILNWVEQLDEIDTTSVEPMTRVVAQEMKQRPDKVTDGEIADDVVKNAPMTEDHYFVVPKVVE